MIEYKKHKSGREFYMADFAANNDYVIRIVSMGKFSIVTAGENWLIKQDAFLDGEDCTEQEFKEALQVALERINKMKIV